MYIHSTITNAENHTINLYILTDSDPSQTLELAIPPDGIIITQKPEDLFTPIITSTATITILTSSFIPQLFTTDCLQTPVIITRTTDNTTQTLFVGYIAPLTYSQPYNEAIDSLTLNCICPLAALQHTRYRNIGTKGNAWTTAKSSAGMVTFTDILLDVLQTVISPIENLATLTATPTRTGEWLAGLADYDNSRAIGAYDIFDSIAINELLLIGEDQDKTWSGQDIVSEIMRYLTLTMRMSGTTFLIADWTTFATATPHTITTSDTAAADCQLTIPETYNRITLTAELKATETLIDNPLSSSALLPIFQTQQRYLTEMWAEGQGDYAKEDFLKIVTGQPATHTQTQAQTRDWYVQIMRHPQWNLRQPMAADYYKAAINQHQAITALKNGIYAEFIQLGNITTDAMMTNDTPVTSINQTPYLVISVNGNSSAKTPTDSNIQNAAPVAEYKSATAGGVFSPADTSYDNFIAISGNIAIAPTMLLSVPWKNVRSLTSVEQLQDELDAYNLDGEQFTVPSRNNSDGRIYTRKYWTAQNTRDTPQPDITTADAWYPLTDDCPQQYTYNYSTVGDSTDRISKLAVIQCMLIIGDKCVVESGDGGSIDNYTWQTYRTLEECGNDIDTYYAQSFSLGVNPAIGDHIIGQKYPIPSNFDYTLGLQDTTGTVIRISATDHVSGSVTFRILGPVNTMWNDISRRHATWFRHTQWTENDIQILTQTSSIVISDFSMRVVTNAPQGTSDQLVYESKTDETFTNQRDDITFRITSALTADEAAAHNVTQTVSLSTAVTADDFTPITQIKDNLTGENVKPEILHVSRMYGLHHNPHIQLDLTLRDTPDIINPTSTFIYPPLPNTFFIQAITRNLTQGTATLTLRSS